MLYRVHLAMISTSTLVYIHDVGYNYIKHLIFTLLYIGHSDIFLFFCLGEGFNEGNELLSMTILQCTLHPSNLFL
jgi:hypothetical protein